MKILKRMILKQYNFSCNEEPQSIELNPGLYLFECWGAKGFKTEHSISEDGCLYASGGGGYASGFMFLHETKSFFVYVGKAGKSKSSTFNSNNLTYSSYYGGGATDIRLEGGEWYLFESLKTRIIVAGGSGATERYCGGEGGGIEGNSNSLLYNTSYYAEGGTQTRGGKYGTSEDYGHGTNGSFGMGGVGDCIDNPSSTCDIGPAGGGGYYGGGGVSYKGAGGGGSSFVSGLKGCDAINETSTEFNIIHTNQPFHYSGYYFINPSIISGHEYFRDPEGQITQGKQGDGYARITMLSTDITCLHKSYNQNIIPYCLLLIII